MNRERLIIDGNNLMFALADELVDAGRSMLATMLAEYVAFTGAEVCLVFDGAPSRGDEAERLASVFPHIHFSGAHTADEVITRLVKSYSAPRTLTVVSSDRQLRKAAARRKAVTEDSPSFTKRLLEALKRAKDAPREPVEPPEKRAGLAEGDLDRWLEEFGI